MVDNNQQSLGLEDDVQHMRWLLDATCHSSLFKPNFDPPQQIEPKYRQAISLIHNKVGLTLRALIDIHSTIESLSISHQMARRFPWHGTRITKHQSLETAHFLFVNQAYLYETKVKNFGNTANKAAEFLLGRPIADTAKLIRRAKKGLHSHIKSRGELFHEFHVPHKWVGLHSLYSVASGVNPAEFDGVTIEVYRATKFVLSNEIKEAQDFMQSDFREIQLHHKEAIIQMVATFDRIDTISREAPEKIASVIQVK